MITYEYDSVAIDVKLDGKLVGHIWKKLEGFQYIPKGQKTGGAFFPTVRECKNSLEAA